MTTRFSNPLERSARSSCSKERNAPPPEVLRLAGGKPLDHAPDDLRHPHVALHRRDVVGLAPRSLDAVDQRVDRALLDARLAERGQDVRDVLHERPVRADDEHAGAAELLAVLVEQPRRPVQADRRLAGSGAALDGERRPQTVRDQPVLVGLDRRDDVAHVRVARAVQVLEQEVPAGDGRRRAVEGLVRDREQPPPLDPEAAAQRDALRIGGCGGVERPGGGRLPVDDDRPLLGVVHPTTADVDGAMGSLEVEPAEAEAAARILVRPEALRRPGVDQLRLVLRDHHVLRAFDDGAHALQAFVCVVEVGLLGCEVRVRHGRQVVPDAGARVNASLGGHKRNRRSGRHHEAGVVG